MKTRIILLILLTFSAYNVQAKGVITFEKSAHDFGMILEKDGNVSYTFTFTNTGDEPVIINNVTASCGCTTPEWTKNPVLPGKKGTVTATYLPAGRPGPFDKSLTVISNAQESSVTIRIKGEVVQKIPSFEEQYPITIGKSLRIESKDIAYARIAKGVSKTATLSVYNNGTEPIKITFDKVPAYLSFKVEPDAIAPKSKATITCTYNTTAKNDWGFVAETVSFKINGKKVENATLNISATILDDFSRLTSADRTIGPYPQFKVTTQAFDNTVKGSLINTSFVLTNSGEQPMTIRKVSSENRVVITSASKTTVRAGESIEIKITIDTSTFDEGAFTVPISVFSNSPRNPQANLMVTGSIIK